LYNEYLNGISDGGADACPEANVSSSPKDVRLTAAAYITHADIVVKCGDLWDNTTGIKRGSMHRE
jgi:hypothetical protein